MILIHVEDLKKEPMPKCEVTKITCSSGWDMANTVSRISKFCKNSNSESLVVWDTTHHTVLLWFEEEKIKTLFRLMGVIKGA